MFPDLSVIIPVFNAEKTLEAALKSVASQDYEGQFEIILIDDGSTDGSLQVAEKFSQNYRRGKMRILKEENMGVASARNAGLRIARQDFVAFLDADDVWQPEKTRLQMSALHYDKLDFVACRRNNFPIRWPYKVDARHLAEITFQKLLLRNETQPSTVIFHRRILLDSGLFEEGRRFAEDHLMWLKMAAVPYTRMAILDKSLVWAGGGKRSFGSEGLSANLKEMAAGFQDNLQILLQEKLISAEKYRWLRLFYKMKSRLLLLRKNINF